jgi:hypothetical protein
MGPVTTTAKMTAEMWFDPIYPWAWLRQHGPKVIKPLYDAMGSRIHLGGEEDHRAVLVRGTPGFFEIKRTRTVGPVFSI